MYNHLHLWPLKFYFYTKRIRTCHTLTPSAQKLSLFQVRSNLSHRFRLRFDEHIVPDQEQARIEYYETHAEMLPRRFVVYQRLWTFPFYLYRSDIHRVVLDGQFFYGIPTSSCLFSLGCPFVLIERSTDPPFLICFKAVHHSYSEGSET